MFAVASDAEPSQHAPGPSDTSNALSSILILKPRVASSMKRRSYSLSSRTSRVMKVASGVSDEKCWF